MTSCMSYGWFGESGMIVSSVRSSLGERPGPAPRRTTAPRRGCSAGRNDSSALRYSMRVVLVGGHVVGVARLGVVGAGAAEVLHRDVLAGDGLDDVGTGDEHVGRAVDHDREVGDGGGVDVAAGAGAHDQADLRDHAGGVHVAAEDLAVEAERDHALLDPRAGALVDADDRAAGLDGEVHHLADLLAVDLAERAAEDGEVLGEHAHLPAVDGAVAGDHAVAVRAVLRRGRTPWTGAGPARRARRRCPRRRAARSARGRSCGPWRAASRPPWPSPRGPPRRAGARGPRACPRWCGCRCRQGRRCPRPGVRSRDLASWVSVGQCSAREPRRRPAPAPRRRPAGPAAAWWCSPTRPRPTLLVAERARDGAPEWLVVATEHQTAGRGRLDRTWETPDRAALTFSTLLRPDAPAAAWPWLPLLAGVAVVEALREHDVAAGLKWPNDVCWSGRGEAKVAGILVERVDTPDRSRRRARHRAQRRTRTQASSRSPRPPRSGWRPGATSTAPRCWSRCSAGCAREYDAWSAGGGAGAAPGVRRGVRDARPRGAGRAARAAGS